MTEAVAADVQRLVLLSAPAAETDGPLRPAELAVRGSGVDWAILRPTWFSQNFSEDFFLPGVLDGTLSLPTGDGRTPFVDAEDIADVAPDVFVERQVARGVPPDIARLLTGLLLDIRNGGGAELADGVERALGRPPRPFEDYVTATAFAGHWT